MLLAEDMVDGIPGRVETVALVTVVVVDVAQGKVVLTNTKGERRVRLTRPQIARL